jgi:hypothetical protein
MDYIVEAVAGQYGYFYIQAKDAYRNNRNVGGDSFSVLFVNEADDELQYRGVVEDKFDGTYTAYYTIPLAGTYRTQVTLNQQAIRLCPAASAPHVFDRKYDGLKVYETPSFCVLDQNTSLLVVHNELHVASSTIVDLTGGLTSTITGRLNRFKIQARDEFSNLRIGAATNHFDGYGDGKSDFFIAEFTHQLNRSVITTSSAIEYIGLVKGYSHGYFRLAYGGALTDDISVNVSASALETILERVQLFTWNILVDEGENATHKRWQVTFLDHLREWQVNPLKLLAPHAPSDASAHMMITRPAVAGVYLMEFTLWYVGQYSVSITSNGYDVLGSPFALEVTNSPLDATSSFAMGAGLASGISGHPFEFAIQARDAWHPQQQTMISSAFVAPYTPEVQELTWSGNTQSFRLSFAGEKTSVINPSSATLSTLKSALETMYTIGTGGVTVAATTSVLQSLSSFQVTFSGLYGDMPQLSVIPASAMTVSEITPGDAPFRKEVQVFNCSALSGSFTVSFHGRSTSAIQHNTSLTHLGMELSRVVEVSVVSTGSTVCSGEKIYITFDSEKGDVEQLLFNTTDLGARIEQYSDQDSGAFNGIFPLWGTFRISAGQQLTPPLSFDASASDVQLALETLDSVGYVTVTKSGYHSVLDSDGNFYFDRNTTAFNVWTVIFGGTCSREPYWRRCPTQLGRVKLEVDPSGLFFSESRIYHQQAPMVSVVETVIGSEGNDLAHGEDLQGISISVKREDGAEWIGMTEIQAINCTGNASGSFMISMLGVSVNVSASSTQRHLESLINAQWASMNIFVQINATGTSICAEYGSTSILTFSSPEGPLPLLSISDSVNISVVVIRVRQGIDSIKYVSAGLFSVVYTPLIKGRYVMCITIYGVQISTDFSAGVFVVSDTEYAFTTSHNASKVVTEGEREHFTVVLRDVWGNILDGPLSDTSILLATMEGAGRSEPPTSSSIDIMLDPRPPYTDGHYTFTYDPTTAGTYNLSVQLIVNGGLTGTFYPEFDMFHLC